MTPLRHAKFQKKLMSHFQKNLYRQTDGWKDRTYWTHLPTPPLWGPTRETINEVLDQT